MKIALDTNLIAWETPRRLLHGIADETGFGITILPEVDQEATRWLVEKEEEAWFDRIGEDTSYTVAQREQIVNAASKAAAQWFKEELDRTDTPWRLQEETFEQGVRARRIARNLPAGVVRRGGIVARGDRLVIAQAAVHGVTVLATNNLKSIDHERANKWFTEKLRLNHAVVLTPDDCVTELADGNKKTTYQWTIAYGERWTSDVLAAGEDAIRQAYEECLDRLTGAGFEKTAQKARWEYENEAKQQFLQNLHKALIQPSGRLAQKAERRRVEQIQRAAKEAGWNR